MARVLVVDDEDGLRSFLGAALRTEGHHVEEAGDGEEARGLLEKRSFQVLVTDLKMPRLDGIALLEWANKEQPELEVVVLTAHGSVGSAVAAMKLGAFDYLEKPLDSPDLLRLVVKRAAERHALRTLRDSARATEEPELSYRAPAMRAVEDALRKVAATDATVLLSGESGSGKEVCARALHRWSPRSSGPFVAVNCAALAETLLESELFGHEKGAFTGAVERRRGRIELTDGGTFFLDEIGELKPGLQAKLLRVLEERCFERLGGALTIRVDVRWVAATNRDLEAMVREGSFREDLYHRLAVFPIAVPPLRARREDIPALAQILLTKTAGRLGRSDLRLDDSAQQLLSHREWPGNIRELANAIERAAILSDGSVLTAASFDTSLGPTARTSSSTGSTLAEIERDTIRTTLDSVDGNRRLAAERLGIGLRTLYDKLKRYELS